MVTPEVIRNVEQHLVEEVSRERRRTIRWIGIWGVTAVIAVLGVAVAVAEAMYGRL